MAPPLRIVGSSTVAERRIEPERVAAPARTPREATDLIPDNVIVLRNPLATRPVEPAQEPTEEEDLFGASASPEAEEPPSLSADLHAPLAEVTREGDEPVLQDPRSGHAQLKFGVLVGLILAAGIVALAILFRPAVTAEQALSVTDDMAQTVGTTASNP